MVLSRLNIKHAVVVVVDVQERLAAAIPETRMASLIKNSALLLDAARLLQAPVLITEQYPKGLGATVGPLINAIAAFQPCPPIIEKLSFDALDEPMFDHVLMQTCQKMGHEEQTIILAGLETHVCVFQTARGFISRGKRVVVADDAVASRRDALHASGVAMLGAHGVELMPTEAIVFDWLRTASHPSFKDISALVRASS